MRQKQILVVDDEPVQLAKMIEILKSNPAYEVHSATNSFEAEMYIREMKNQGKLLNLLVVDCVLISRAPKSGENFARDMLRQHQIPYVLITGVADEAMNTQNPIWYKGGQSGSLFELIKDVADGYHRRGFIVYAMAQKDGWFRKVRETLEDEKGRFGLQVVALDENQRGTADILSQLIREIERCSFVIILATDDDEARPAGSSETLESRARQNVIFELGYSLAYFRSEKVFVLKEPKVILPSDVGNIFHIKLDDSWENSLYQQMKNVGIPLKG
jgi:CheY-like chemotaxis protein